MKCEEQLYNDGETYSSRDCQLQLGHAGHHEYFGQKYPRPVPAEPDTDVADLIERAARKHGAWDLDEMQWPIVVEVTSVYVIKAPGATEDEALQVWDNGDYPDLDGEQAIDGGFEIRRVDRWQRSDVIRCSPFGPQIQCPGCGELAMRREWFHDPFRKCHGPIEWRENAHARTLQWRYRREFQATPGMQAVAS
ncbi:hypothetical protein OG978_32370 [Streptomyces sp. NBC_01591]|uniref:hypothetical protein n=1 Tax=Streptomyces sp. NBC_01591 TaxID=2975888 RepID=UPI002DD97C0F|nr:hypothetical protein [Streptomyces sp. NBC_01591]WSD71669.1 hypothetical protein OG978_32370 [Streptomyces sp. NBC_01591]